MRDNIPFAQTSLIVYDFGFHNLAGLAELLLEIMLLDIEEEIPNIEGFGHVMSCRSSSSGRRANCATRRSSDLASSIRNLCRSSVGRRLDSFGY